MKSIKPGRGPSMMSGAAAAASAVFGVFWLIMAIAVTSSAPDVFPFNIVRIIFPLFGVVFIVLAIVNAVYNFKNATGKKRYSQYDIVDGTEEPDPLNERFGETSDNERTAESAFCPFCGTKVEKDYEYCNRCGKKLP